MEPALSTVRKVQVRDDNAKQFGAGDERIGIERRVGYDFYEFAKEEEMRAMRSVLVLLVVILMADSKVATAQQAVPATSTLPATYVSAADIQANLNGAPNAATNPQPNVRVVDAGGYNIAVGVIHRPQTPLGGVAVHFKVTEIYHVMEGAGTLVTGGTMVNAKMRPADALSVRLEDGPGASGTSIQGGVTRKIRAGDVVVIPAGVPHWFSEIEGSITYVVMRVDPDRLLALK
jgi:mannose-6-phosphate isomerase-like protein (cupin superfamily)